MFNFKKHIPRRTVLKGAGVTLALPLLDAMVPASTALAQTAAAPKMRAGFFYIPHGAVQHDTKFGIDGDLWTPKGKGADFKLNKITASLEPFKKYVTSIGNLENNNGSGVRGDLRAVVRQVLLDPEARGPAKTDPGFGTLREPVLMITGLVRALNGVTDGAALGDRAANLLQRPYYSPTVFNYFQTDSTVPGTSIVAPEFGIFNSNAAVARTNLVYSLVYGGINPDANLIDAKGTRLNTIQFEPLATDAAVLTDKVSEALLGGPLPAAARTAVINAVNAIALSATPTAQQKTDRARMATYLIAASNHYQIQR